MKRLLLLITIALGSALLTAAALVWSAQPRTQATPTGPYRPQGPGALYLALGDSLATGFRLADPARESYVALLAARLAPLGVGEHRNLAVAGATSASLLERQLPQAVETIARAQAAGLRVSPISVGIGGNDMRAVERAGGAERERALEQLALNLGQALDTLREAAPDADIAVMTYYDPYGGDAGVPGSDAAWIARFNATIRAEAERRGVAVADVEAAFGGGRSYEYTNILLGDVHANRQGHVGIAAQFWQALGY
jgi:lysophospholipase L1-like esterase